VDETRNPDSDIVRRHQLAVFDGFRVGTQVPKYSSTQVLEEEPLGVSLEVTLRRQTKNR
jgi:hypothetical protein